MTRLDAVRRFALHHLVHHRGQLTVYLRLLDVPLPPIYWAGLIMYAPALYGFEWLRKQYWRRKRSGSGIKPAAERP